MYVEQLFTECLAEMAYYIESDGEAIIIDPLRETTPYLELAKKRGAQIKYVMLTHFHADFVSGHLDLANKTGAKIIFGPNATTAFEFHQGTDGEEFKLGSISLKLLHTPGHTMESSSFLLIDENGNTPYLFSGDALFIGDVGRPDLAVKSALTKTDLAGHLFDSLRNKIMPLPDDTIIYPAHGAGSACGKNMSSETFDTLGNQKATNYALRADMTKDEFIQEVTDGLATPPQYFPKNVSMNKGINKSYEDILTDGNTPLTVTEFKHLQNNEAVLVMDVRHEHDFVKAHLKGAFFFGLDGGFAPWVGTLITDLTTPILLIVPEGREVEAITRLARVGYDNVIGYLKGGISAWKNAGEPIESINHISAAEFATSLTRNDTTVLDVRKNSEYFSERVMHANSVNSPLDGLLKEHTKLDQNKTYYVHCLAGYRSVIAISILKANGFTQLINVQDGFEAIVKNGNIATSDYVCPTTMPSI